MGKKLYVGNLSFSTNEQSLTDLFSNCGSVDSAKVIMDRDTGRSKGFAFVEMSSDEEAKNCISELDGKDLEGRQIKVSLAKPQEDKPNRGGFQNGGQSRY